MKEYKQIFNGKYDDKGAVQAIDMLNDNPNNLRLFALRSFGESLYHSVSDACLEDGYKVM